MAFILVRVCKPKNQYLQTIVMCRGGPNQGEWQQFSPISSSENIVKYVKIKLFMVAVFCNLVRLGQYFYPSFERLSTPTRKHRYLNIIDQFLVVASYMLLIGDTKNVS